MSGFKDYLHQKKKKEDFFLSLHSHKNVLLVYSALILPIEGVTDEV